jgi:hypothetical protein
MDLSSSSQVAAREDMEVWIFGLASEILWMMIGDRLS